MTSIAIPNTMENEGLYDNRVQPTAENETYYHSLDAASPAQQPAYDAYVYGDEEYEPYPFVYRVEDAFETVVDTAREIFEQLMQYQYPEDEVQAQLNRGFRQRMKSLFAMVLLTCIASIAVLNQLGNKASLPPLTTDLMQSLAPVVNNQVAAAPAIVSHSGLISPVFSPEVQRWAPNIVAWANDFNVDPNAVATIMQIESCGDPLAESWAGAQGLFQVMPFHFEAHEQMKDPDTNAYRGVAYFALGMDMTNDNIGRSLAGYNGGHGTAKRDYNTWPNETQRYFYWGTGIYDDASRGLEISPRLDEWMAAGGASLCAQAASRNVSMHTQ